MLVANIAFSLDYTRPWTVVGEDAYGHECSFSLQYMEGNIYDEDERVNLIMSVKIFDHFGVEKESKQIRGRYLRSGDTQSYTINPDYLVIKGQDEQALIKLDGEKTPLNYVYAFEGMGSSFENKCLFDKRF